MLDRRHVPTQPRSLLANTEDARCRHSSKHGESHSTGGGEWQHTCKQVGQFDIQSLNGTKV